MFKKALKDFSATKPAYDNMIWLVISFNLFDINSRTDNMNWYDWLYNFRHIQTPHQDCKQMIFWKYNGFESISTLLVTSASTLFLPHLLLFSSFSVDLKSSTWGGSHINNILNPLSNIFPVVVREYDQYQEAFHSLYNLHLLSEWNQHLSGIWDIRSLTQVLSEPVKMRFLSDSWVIYFMYPPNRSVCW